MGIEIRHLDIRRVDGTVQRYELPSFGDDPKARERIDTAANAICEEWGLRKAARTGKIDEAGESEDGPALKLKAWLRPLCYQLIENCIQTATLRMLNTRMYNYGVTAERASNYCRPIIGIFAKDISLLTKSERELLGREMYYCCRHYVPWQFVDGFLTAISEFNKKESIEGFEFGFEEWIIERRSQLGRGDKYRGIYPRNIEKAVREEESLIPGLISSLADAMSGQQSPE